MPFNQSGGGGATSILQSSTTSLTTGDLTTTSTSFTNATGVAVTMTTGPHRCLVIFSGTANNATSGDNSMFDLLIDASRQGGTNGLVFVQSPATGGNNIPCGFTFLTGVLSAASHTFQIQFRCDAGTAKLWASSTAPAILTVIETGLTT